MSDPDLRDRPSDLNGPDATTDDIVRPERRRMSRHRLVIELSPDLHRRILTISAARGTPVNQAVQEVLERAFPRGKAAG